VAGSCEHCNEILGFIKGWEFLDYLSGYKVLWKSTFRRQCRRDHGIEQNSR
jgi:hypothetical protein